MNRESKSRQRDKVLRMRVFGIDCSDAGLSLIASLQRSWQFVDRFMAAPCLAIPIPHSPFPIPGK